MISLLNKFPIIPNQVRDLKKYENLFQDVSIEEILKQILDKIDTTYRIKDSLMSNKIKLEFPLSRQYTSEKLISKIDNFLKTGFNEVKGMNNRKMNSYEETAWKQKCEILMRDIIPLIPKKEKNPYLHENRLKIWNWAKISNFKIPLSYVVVNLDNEKLWQESDNFYLSKCLSLINSTQTLSELTKAFNIEEEELIIWINEFYSKLNHTQHKSINCPNQLKEFIYAKEEIKINSWSTDTKENLFLDCIADKQIFLIKKKSQPKELVEFLEFVISKTDILKDVLRNFKKEDPRKKLIYLPVNNKYVQKLSKYTLRDICDDIDQFIGENKDKIKDNHLFVKTMLMFDKEIVSKSEKSVGIKFFPKYMKDRATLFLESLGNSESKDLIYEIITHEKTKLFSELNAIGFNNNDLDIFKSLKNDEKLYDKVKRMI